MPLNPYQNLQENLEELNIPNNIGGVFSNLTRDETCEGCGEMVSPCCQKQVSLIRGTLPLRVKCVACEKEFVLKELIDSL